MFLDINQSEMNFQCDLDFVENFKPSIYMCRVLCHIRSERKNIWKLVNEEFLLCTVKVMIR